MKKKLLLFLIFILLFMPMCTFAAQQDFTSMNLEQTLEDEQIEKVFSDYKETDKQIPIYLFRGAGCDYCKAFLSYLNSITDDYGDYFKLVSYEVWSNPNNGILLNSVSSFFGEEATGVPYIVIGDRVFPGYAEDFNEDIKKAIVELYKSEEKYDVFEKMPKVVIESDDENLKTPCMISNNIVVICSVIVVTVGVTIIIMFSHFKYKKMYLKLDALEKQLKELSNKNTRLQKKELKK